MIKTMILDQIRPIFDIIELFLYKIEFRIEIKIRIRIELSQREN